MNVLSIILTIALVLVALAIIGVVLVQKTRSGGVGSAFGGESSSFAERGRATSRETKLQKITIVLGVIFGLLAIVLAAVSPKGNTAAPVAEPTAAVEATAAPEATEAPVEATAAPEATEAPAEATAAPAQN
ncbi:MAG: preprotein translocase subunit SecG [Clostridia bacterium]|nr:preprotein translocase subunit SecG [Clostridia bacterium]